MWSPKRVQRHQGVPGFQVDDLGATLVGESVVSLISWEVGKRKGSQPREPKKYRYSLAVIVDPNIKQLLDLERRGNMYRFLPDGVYAEEKGLMLRDLERHIGCQENLHHQ